MNKRNPEAVTTFAEVLSSADVAYHQQGRQITAGSRHPVIYFQETKI